MAEPIDPEPTALVTGLAVAARQASRRLALLSAQGGRVKLNEYGILRKGLRWDDNGRAHDLQAAPNVLQPEFNRQFP